MKESIFDIHLRDLPRSSCSHSNQSTNRNWNNATVLSIYDNLIADNTTTSRFSFLFLFISLSLYRAGKVTPSRLRVVCLEQEGSSYNFGDYKKEGGELPIPLCLSTSLVQEQTLRQILLSPGPVFPHYPITLRPLNKLGWRTWFMRR